MQQRKTLSEGIAAGNVRQFVSDDGVKLRIFPLAPGGGQDNGGTQRTHGDRHGNQLGFGSLRNGGKAPGGCARGEAPCLEPSSSHGFVIDEAEVTYWGLCPSCQGRPTAISEKSKGKAGGER